MNHSSSYVENAAVSFVSNTDLLPMSDEVSHHYRLRRSITSRLLLLWNLREVLAGRKVAKSQPPGMARDLRDIFCWCPRSRRVLSRFWWAQQQGHITKTG